jgi:hypothetical protein
MQAFQKRGLCRELLDDNGSAMTAAEVEQALLDLGILHSHTLPDSPYQNGKQEAFWGTVEKRLMPMLDDVRHLTLELLNEATQAWVELDYNRRVHKELGVTPLERFLEGPDVLRECPQSEALRLCFRQKARRTQRKSDGTVSIEGQRFEVPSRFRTLEHVFVRYARWDLSRVDIVDPRHDTCVARLYPQDKHKNADGKRRLLEPVASMQPIPPPPTGEVAPLLRQLMSEYAKSGLPPAYLPIKPIDITDPKEPSP